MSPNLDAVAMRRAVLDRMLTEVVEFEKDKGWTPNDNRFAESLMLLVSEAGEALDAWRKHGFTTVEQPVQLEDGTTVMKPLDAASELADVFIRLLSTWAQWMTPRGFDLTAEFERKMMFNRTRSFRHGGRAL